MTNERAVELLKIEKECILRQDTSMCNRDTCGCQCCDLVQDSEDILAAYDMAISALTADPDAEAFKAGYIKGAIDNNAHVSDIADGLYNKLIGGGT